jgi:hypothetical protein
VLTAALKLATAEALELREALWLASTTLTAELRLDVEEIAPEREELICETDVERPISGGPLGRWAATALRSEERPQPLIR